MFLYHTYVTPTAETSAYLRSIMGAAPLDILFDNLAVTLMISEQEVEPDAQQLYSAKASQIGLYYDEQLQSSSWIVALESNSLMNGHNSMVEQGVEHAFGRYIPYLTLVPAIPPLHHKVRSFINSVSSTLATYGETLFFTNETVLYQDFLAPPARLFHEQYVTPVRPLFGAI